MPLAVSATSGEALAALQIKTATDLRLISPSLNFTPSANARGEGFAIRGVGTAIFSDTVEQSVGVVVDGVVLGRSGQATGDLLDLERVDVLRAMRPWTFDLSFFGHYLTNWSLIIVMWVLASAASAEWRKRAQAMPHADDAPLPASNLHGVLLRLPAVIGHDVIALQAEDHYVRVHTRHGNALVLGSLSEAAADLERSGIEGQRTHRSWWVANGAVTAQHKRGRQLYLQLVNGIEAPVSVTYRQMATRSIAVAQTVA